MQDRDKIHQDFWAHQNQGTIALLTLGKVHILAPVAHGFGRNSPFLSWGPKSQNFESFLLT